jgi:hypothetical protein
VSTHLDPPALVSSVDDSDGTIGISNSEIQTFKQCRRKWYIGYYLKFRPRRSEVVSPRALGTRVHKALEEYYANDIPLLDTHAALIREDRALLESQGQDASELDNDAELGSIMLDGYRVWVEEEGLDANLEILSVEEMMKTPVETYYGTANLIGKLDLRVRNLLTGARSVLDFKTAMAFSNFTGTAHIAEQLPTYMILDRATHEAKGDSDYVEGGIYRILRKVKRGPRATPPFYGEFEVRYNEFQLRSVWTRLTGTFTEMLRTRKALNEGGNHLFLAYPSPDSSCSWKCDAYTICPLFDDGSDFRGMLDDEFEQVDPYAYYGLTPEGGADA